MLQASFIILRLDDVPFHGSSYQIFYFCFLQQHSSISRHGTPSMVVDAQLQSCQVEQCCHSSACRIPTTWYEAIPMSVLYTDFRAVIFCLEYMHADLSPVPSLLFPIPCNAARICMLSNHKKPRGRMTEDCNSKISSPLLQSSGEARRIATSRHATWLSQIKWQFTTEQDVDWLFVARFWAANVLMFAICWDDRRCLVPRRVDFSPQDARQRDFSTYASSVCRVEARLCA